MSALLGFSAHRRLPEGEALGAMFWHCGEKYYVTQTELDRVRAMPDAETVQQMVTNLRKLMPTP